MKPTGPEGTPYHMNPNVPYIKNPKPAANDLLRELMTAPGGLDKMNQQQQYGKLVEMRQRQAMVDRSDGAMREYQRLTQNLTDEQRAGLKGRGDVDGVPRMVQEAVRAATARQKRELEDAGAQVQSRAVGRGDQGIPTVGGAANVGARPVTSDSVIVDREGNFQRAYGMGRNAGVRQERERAAGRGRGRG